MAKSRLTRYLSILWDKDAARRLQQEADATFDKVAASGGAEFAAGMQEGGRKAARTLSTSLTREFKIRMARARLDLAEGAIDERAFEKEGRDAAQAFNKGLTGGIRKLRAQGGTSDLQLAGLAGQFKRVPGGTAAGVFGRMGGMMGGLAAPLAGIFTARAALGEARNTIEAADELESSIRKLGGTAQLAGLDFDELKAAAERSRVEFKLGTVAANDLTGMMTRIAERAGDITQSEAALRAWLDLAAAGGLKAADALQALEVTFRGQDEGLNRLGLANPEQIYQKWGAGADEASKAQALLSEILAEGAKVQGEWGRQAETSGGQADQAASKMRDLRAEIGGALQPVRDLANELKIGLYGALVDIATKISEIVTSWRTGPWAEKRAARMGMFPAWMTMGRGGGDTGATGSWELSARAQNDADVAALRARMLDNGVPIVRPLGALPTEAEKKAAEDRVKALWAHLETWSKGQQAFNVVTGTGLAGQGGAPGAGDPNLDPVAVVKSGWTEYLEMLPTITAASEEAAYQISSAFQDAFTRMMDEGATLGSFMEGLGRGIAGSFLAGLAQFAQGKAMENIAAAIEAAAYALGFTSHGNFASAGAAWASAAQHGAAAIAWGALAGGAGAGRGAVTGGGGAIPASTRDVGLATAERAEKLPPEIHIYSQILDPSSPALQKVIYGANQLADERFGGGQVYVQAGGGR